MTDEEPPEEFEAEQRPRRRWLIIGGILLNLVLIPVLVAVACSVMPSTPRYYGSTDPPTDIYSTPYTIDTTLDRQASALVAGDEAGWLAAVDPSNPTLVAQYRDLYDRLHNLRVIGLAHTATVDPARRNVATVSYGICAQTPTCPAPHPETDELYRLPPAELYRTTVTWRPVDPHHNLIVGFEPLPPDPRNPTQPLLMGPPLTSMRGQRVLILSGPDLASELPDAVLQAEAAARNADKYDQLAGWEHPTQYVVYLADPAQWRTWFGGAGVGAQRDVLGYENADSRSSSVVVLNMAAIRASGESIEAVMRHEFGHVVSPLGADYRDDTAITEGIAEYVEEDGRPIAQYEQLPAVADYLRSHRWNGDPSQLDQYIYVNNENSNAAYGIGYLTLRCLASQYGQTTMFDFVTATLHDGQIDDDAAPKVFGRSWKQVYGGCESYVRQAA